MHLITEYSPFARDVQENPYPYYDWLRRAHPVYYNEPLGFWTLSRYADVLMAARTPEVFSSAQGVGPDKRRGLSTPPPPPPAPPPPPLPPTHPPPPPTPAPSAPPPPP